MHRKLISICVATFNEVDNVVGIYSRISKSIESLSAYDFEIIFYDNDSQDDTRKLIRELCDKDKRVKAIFNSRNYGPGRSSRNALMATRGDVVISVAGDQQDPPELIPEFIRHWEQGYPVVFGQKTSSENKRFDWFARSFFYWVIKRLSDTPPLSQVTGFGLLDRSVVDVLNKMRDSETPIRYLIPDLGFRVKLIPYVQDRREKGRSSYNLYKRLSFGILAICISSRKPLRFMTISGFLFSVTSLLIGMVYLVYKLLNWNSFSAGAAPLLIGVFFIGSVQLFCLGLIGEYVGIITEGLRSKGRPMVVEDERINF